MEHSLDHEQNDSDSSDSILDCEQSDSDSSDSSLDTFTVVLTGNSSSVQFGHENILLGEKQLSVPNTESSVVPVLRKISENEVSVINMIDFHEGERMVPLIGQLLKENEIRAFIFVVGLGQWTDADKMSLEWLQRSFGDNVFQFVVVLFTYEAEEECDDLKKNPDLEKLLEKCAGRYQTCNKMMNNQSEINDLMDKIEHLFNENQKQHYGGEMDDTLFKLRRGMKNRKHGSDHKQETEQKAQLNFILLGNNQVEKSKTGNTILGRQAFTTKKASKSTSQDVTVESGNINGFPVTVFNTPGFRDPKLSEEEIRQMINENVLQKCELGLWVFLLVIKADRFTEDDTQTVETIEEILGEKHLKNTWILFTRGDQLEKKNITVTELMDENEELKTLVQKYDQRYHVFNNKNEGSTDQAGLLLGEVIQRNSGMILNRHIPEADKEPGTPASMRIVLVGKTGVGKSASGNTILGQKEFNSELNSKSVTSVCSVKDGIVSGRSVSVIDTPGFFDTRMKPKKLMKEIARSVYLSSPGPHAFLIVLRADDRFTQQEQQIPRLIEMMFGQEVVKYSMILFTRGDQLEGTTVEKLLEENSNLRHLVQKCGGRYQLFNNKDLNNREQVNDLLQKIDSMVQQNGGGHYTNQLYQDAHRFRQEEKKRRLKEQGERTLEEKTGEGELDNPEFRQFYKSHKSGFSPLGLILGSIGGGVGLGSAVGAAIGLIGGPVGMAIGASLGFSIGSVAGSVVAAVLINK